MVPDRNTSRFRDTEMIPHPHERVNVNPVGRPVGKPHTPGWAQILLLWIGGRET